MVRIPFFTGSAKPECAAHRTRNHQFSQMSRRFGDDVHRLRHKSNGHAPTAPHKISFCDKAGPTLHALLMK
jgi:hypothetical protein